MSKTKTVSEDLNPRKIKIGKFEFPPLTINTAILLEQINSPFMRAERDAEGKPVAVVPTIEEFAQTLYVLINAEDPRIHDVLSDEMKFRSSVSALAMQISFKDIAVISGQLNRLMGDTDQAIKDSGLEGDGKKKETGPLSS